MKSVPQRVLELPLEKRALLALKAAVKKAIAERTRAGLPVYVWSAGHVVDLSSHKARVHPAGQGSELQRTTRRHN